MNSLQTQVNLLTKICLAQSEQERQRLKMELRGQLQGPDKPQDLETIIRQMLLELGAPDSLLGHGYTVRAVELMATGKMLLGNITFGLYPQLAAEFNTQPARVERAIRHLIEVTWTRGDLEVLERYFGNTVSPQRGKPTNGEFLARLSNLVRQKTKGGWAQ